MFVLHAYANGHVIKEEKVISNNMGKLWERRHGDIQRYSRRYGAEDKVMCRKMGEL